MAQPSDSGLLSGLLSAVDSTILTALAVLGAIAASLAALWRVLSRLDKNEREIERIGAAHDERLDGLERDMKAVATKGDMADIKADLGRLLDWALGRHRT